MNGLYSLVLRLTGDAQSDRVVPPTGFTARLTVFASAAMTFLAVFALALSLATGRLAEKWGEALAQSSTIRVSAPDGQVDGQVATVLRILETTPGVLSARVLSDEEQSALLEPWFGPDLPLDALPVPRLIEVLEDKGGYDADGLRARLTGEAPGAVLDDHTRWREPLVRAAGRLRALSLISILLIAATTGVMITLAASSALAANAQVIRVLRLVGARDDYIAGAFVRRFTARAAMGAFVGMALGMIAILLLPSADAGGGFLTGLGFQGWHWVLPLLIPPLAAAVAYAATRQAALSTLKERR